MQIEALIERLEGLSGPDRETDCAIGVATGQFEARTSRRPYVEFDYCYEDDDGNLIVPGYGGDQLVPAYSASLDAAIALVEKVLPGWLINLEMRNGIAEDVYLIGPNYRDDRPEEESSPPIAGFPAPVALLIAMFRALAAGGRS